MEELKVGDYVAGEANNGYGITDDNMTCGRVVKVEGSQIKVKVLLHKNNIGIGNRFFVNPSGFIKIDKPEEIKERIVLQPELDEILKSHKLWLQSLKKEGLQADLRDADLCGANLRDADLCGADLRDADLCGADLRDADLCGANLRDADLCGADLRDADLCGADLRDADLRDADLREADLCGADLRDADLRDADLCGADLRDADLRGANLRGADLCGANLRDANYIGSKQANFIGVDLDFCSIPLKCSGLNWKMDKRLMAQLAYHFCSHECEDNEVKKYQNMLLDLANQFHRVGECGRLKAKEIK